MVFHMKDAHSLGIQDRGVLQDADLLGDLLADRDRNWGLDRSSQVGPIQEILSEQ